MAISEQYILTKLKMNETNDNSNTVSDTKTTEVKIDLNDYQEFPITIHDHQKIDYIQSTDLERKETAKSLRQHNKYTIPFYVIVISALLVLTYFSYENPFVDLVAIAAPVAAIFNWRLNSREAAFLESGYQPQKKQNADTTEYQTNENLNELQLENIKTPDTTIQLEEDDMQQNQNETNLTENNNNNNSDFTVVALEENEPNDDVEQAKESAPKPGRSCAIM